MIKLMLCWLIFFTLVSPSLHATETKPSILNEPSASTMDVDQKWRCEQNLTLRLRPVDSQQIELVWHTKRFQLRQQMTQTGAQRYYDIKSGMDLVIIPSKLMLFNRTQGTRLADNCQLYTAQ
jgi:hypothetical protein